MTDLTGFIVGYVSKYDLNLVDYARTQNIKWGISNHLRHCPAFLSQPENDPTNPEPEVLHNIALVRLSDAQRVIVGLQRRISELETVSWYEKTCGYHTTSVAEAISDIFNMPFAVVPLERCHALEPRWGFISGEDADGNYIAHEFATVEEATAAAEKMKSEQEARHD